MGILILLILNVIKWAKDKITEQWSFIEESHWYEMN